MDTRIPQPIRVAIAHVCPVMRTGLTTTIEGEGTMRIAGATGEHNELIALLATGAIDVLVIDTLSFGEAPLSRLRELRRDFPRLGIVVFSVVVDIAPEVLA